MKIESKISEMSQKRLLQVFSEVEKEMSNKGLNTEFVQTESNTVKCDIFGKIGTLGGKDGLEGLEEAVSQAWKCFYEGCHLGTKEQRISWIKERIIKLARITGKEKFYIALGWKVGGVTLEEAGNILHWSMIA